MGVFESSCSVVVVVFFLWSVLNNWFYVCRELDRGEREKLEYHVRHAEGNTERILASLVDPMNEDDPTSLSERVQQLESKVIFMTWLITFMGTLYQHHIFV